MQTSGMQQLGPAARREDAERLSTIALLVLVALVHAGGAVIAPPGAQADPTRHDLPVPLIHKEGLIVRESLRHL
eukprot:5575078-Amphidinium_carterae.1